MPPMGHLGDAEQEIGRVCVQLASPDFKYMTGETITLEGGLGLRPLEISKIHTKHTGECNCVPLFFEKRSAITCRKFE